MRGPNYPRDIGRPSWHSFAPSNPVGEWKGYESGGGGRNRGVWGNHFPRKRLGWIPSVSGGLNCDPWRPRDGQDS